VLRGGSWSYGREHARCAARALAGPGNRGNFLGSRLLCVSPA